MTITSSFSFIQPILCKQFQHSLFQSKKGWNTIDLDLSDPSNFLDGTWTENSHIVGIRFDLPATTVEVPAQISWLRLVKENSTTCSIQIRGEKEGILYPVLDSDQDITNGYEYFLNNSATLVNETDMTIDLSGINPGQYNLALMEVFDYAYGELLNSWDFSDISDIATIGVAPGLSNFTSYPF